MVCKNVYALEMLDGRSFGRAIALGDNGVALDPPEPQPPAEISPAMEASAKATFSLIARS